MWQLDLARIRVDLAILPPSLNAPAQKKPGATNDPVRIIPLTVLSLLGRLPSFSIHFDALLAQPTPRALCVGMVGDSVVGSSLRQ